MLRSPDPAGWLARRDLLVRAPLALLREVRAPLLEGRQQLGLLRRRIIVDHGVEIWHSRAFSFWVFASACLRDLAGLFGTVRLLAGPPSLQCF